MARQVGIDLGKKTKSEKSLGEDHKVSLCVAFSLSVNKRKFKKQQLLYSRILLTIFTQHRFLTSQRQRNRIPLKQ